MIIPSNPTSPAVASPVISSCASTHDTAARIRSACSSGSYQVAYGCVLSGSGQFRRATVLIVISPASCACTSLTSAP